MKTEDFDSVEGFISHSKLRKTFGLVVTGLDIKNKKLYVGYAMQWSRNDLRAIVPKIKKLEEQLGFTRITIPQQAGQHFIQSLKSAELNVKVITTAKDVKNIDDIENLEVLDWVEMTQLFLTLKNNHQIVFPESKMYLKKLEDQVPIFSEHITEVGTANYYAAGEEPDDLIKSLIMSAFSSRRELTEDIDIRVVGGPMRGKRKPSRYGDIGDGRSDAAIISALSGVHPGRYTTYY